jgi:DNA-binding NtrC family response regulator
MTYLDEKKTHASLRNNLGIHAKRSASAEVTPFGPPQPDSFAIKMIGKRAAQVAESNIIEEALERTHWNRKQTAVLLQVSYKALLYKIKKYSLEKKEPL